MSSSLKKSAFILASLAALSKILGILREILFAYFYGTTKELDAYIVAMTIPNNIMHFIVSSTFVVAFVFVYTRFLAENKEDEAQKFSCNVLNFFVLVFTVIVVFSIFFAKYIVKIFAPGFPSDIFNVTVKLTIIMLPSIIFFVTVAVLEGILNSYENFTIIGLKPIILNLSIIASMVLMTKYIGIYSCALGFLFASIFQLVVLTTPVVSKFRKYYFVLDFKNESLKRFIKNFLPLSIAVNISQLNILIDRMIASFLPSGSISALSYSYHMMEAVQSIIGASLATVIFPRINYLSYKGDFVEVKQIISKALSILFYVGLFFTFMFVFLGQPIIKILFQRGAFSNLSLEITNQALFYYAFSIFFVSANYILVRILYALQKIKNLLLITVFSVLLNAILNVILSKFLGIGGITLATTIASAMFFVLSLHIVFKELNIQAFILDKNSLLFAAIYLVSFLIGRNLYTKLQLGYIISFSFSLIFSLVLIIFLSEIFHIKEYKYLKGIILRKVFAK
ncbi:MAG: murein biosynthesis integral membrane protein MurJ [Endomicrobia bacterium]|nr:murein biosynthesis integral membrane protein MurJ [Endomicrobiia bacterium]